MEAKSLMTVENISVCAVLVPAFIHTLYSFHCLNNTLPCLFSNESESNTNHPIWLLEISLPIKIWVYPWDPRPTVGRSQSGQWARLHPVHRGASLKHLRIACNCGWFIFPTWHFKSSSSGVERIIQKGSKLLNIKWIQWLFKCKPYVGRSSV